MRYVVQKENIITNLNKMRAHCPTAEVVGVIKGNGYGLGLIPMAKLLCENGVQTLAVSRLDEILTANNYKTAYTTEITDAKARWAEEMKALSEYAYDEDFKPLIKARDERTIPEFVDMYKGAVTQTAALAYIRNNIADDAIAVAAAGSLPGCMQRMWTSDVRDTYNMEYGYSCMGYEIAGALGSKMAEPDREVYAFCGDGSYLMLHSELVTSIQEKR